MDIFLLSFLAQTVISDDEFHVIMSSTFKVYLSILFDKRYIFSFYEFNPFY
jgi:hypothetical protein